MAATIAKKEEVRTMFNNIAGRYDFLNHFLSAGIDRIWRKKLVKMLLKSNPQQILDVATGTADLAIALAAKTKSPIIGVDISQGMLDIGHQKLKNKGLDHQITLELADSEALPFNNETFDAAMVAFGVRNFEDLDQGLSEISRVVKPGGMVAVLEFSRPKAFPVKQLYHFYFKNILPVMGRMVSKNQSAYTYLPESVNVFPDGRDFLQHLEKNGFQTTAQRRLTFGIATIYTGFKAVIF
jgi:demethylmenaquinone methyltransferase/2-methoxy-6-polyprenyl-1,4-benzoquinol methylase